MKKNIPDNFFNIPISFDKKYDFNESEPHKSSDGKDFKDEDVWTISQLISNINQTLYQNFMKISVIGEISNLKQHPSGHVYLKLKDEKSQIDAVIFRSFFNKLDFDLKDGLLIICTGDVTVYPEQGRIQINIKDCEPAGSGKLHIEFEKLKKKLASKGIFDEKHKKKLPLIPQKVFLITSPSGAAIRDFIKTARYRFPPANLILIPSTVQGEKAPLDLIQALTKAQKIADPENDVIVIIRGGGSIEDLWAFNDEKLAMEIFNCKTPVVSGVGHEIDFTICDFVADHRAPTPTGAAQLVFPEIDKIKSQVFNIKKTLDMIMSHRIQTLHNKIQRLKLQLKDPVTKLNEMGMKIDNILERLYNAISNRINYKKNCLQKILNSFQRLNPMILVGEKRQILNMSIQKLNFNIEKKITHLNGKFKLLVVRLEGASPLALIAKGYSMVFRERDGLLIKSYKDVEIGDVLKIKPKEGNIICEVKETIKD